MDSARLQEISLPAFGRLFLTTPLYDSVDLSVVDAEHANSYLEAIRRPEDSIDAYCSQCGKQSTFAGSPIAIVMVHADCEPIDNGVFGVELRCARNPQHRMYCIFKVEDKSLVKIGQFPSIADLHEAELKQYRQVLEPERYRELTRAVGLASHGIGVGAFVYLRRIFEQLLEQAHEQARQNPAWEEQAYLEAKVEDKVKALAAFLPTFLVEHRSVYGVLSKGIHSLTEDECRQYFGVVLDAIEMMLDEKLEQKRKLEKSKQAATNLEKLRNQLRS